MPCLIHPCMFAYHTHGNRDLCVWGTASSLPHGSSLLKRAPQTLSSRWKQTQRGGEMGSYCRMPESESSALVGERGGDLDLAAEGRKEKAVRGWENQAEELMEEEEGELAVEEYCESATLEEAWMWKGKRKGSSGGVMLEGYVDGWEQGSDGGGEGGGVGRTKSLTDEDLEELKGCLDLGFGFCYEDIPELCNTLPALELCYSMSQRFLDEQQQTRSPESPGVVSEHSHSCSSPIANWKISSPGDHPEEVKARLKYWAQAVACTVRLCS